MTTFTGPLNVKRIDADTTTVAIGVSGQATFAQGTFTIGVAGTGSQTQSGLTIVNVDTTAEVSAAQAGGSVPATAETFMQISVNGTNYYVALYAVT
jgi:hypothetical protein